jgi:hypothetical protein
MTDTNLKSVVFFDRETQEYKPASHNLTPEAALEQVGNLQNDGTEAAILDQESRHRTQTAQKCKLCQNSAKSFTERQETRPSGGEQAETVVEAGEQSEED